MKICIVNSLSTTLCLSQISIQFKFVCTDHIIYCVVTVDLPSARINFVYCWATIYTIQHGSLNRFNSFLKQMKNSNRLERDFTSLTWCCHIHHIQSTYCLGCLACDKERRFEFGIVSHR